MASQTSMSARRGVLSPLNVNSPIGSPALTSMGGKASSAEKSQKLGEILLQEALRGGEMSDVFHQQAGLVGTKRRIGAGEGVGQEGSTKKRKGDGNTQSSEPTVGKVTRDVDDLLRAPLSKAPLCAKSPRSPLRPDADAVSLSSSAPSSPTSSGGFSETALNDTQLTEPDESRVRPTLTQAELRQKAQAIKLRLRLANYKVRTDQIHVPMSRLQIRTIAHECLPTPRVKPQRQTPLPSTPASNIPDIQLQKPSAEKARQTDIMCSSPPPMHRHSLPANNRSDPASPTKNGEEETREKLTTPLLPRHRHGLLNPPNLGSPVFDEKSPGKELTSSVVKRGTADVLLSLKLRR